MSAITIKSDSAMADAAKKLIDMLRGKTPFSRWEAIAAALQLANWLSDLFSGDATTQSKGIKSPRASKKALIEALTPLVSKDASVKSLPIWVLPLLLKLIQKWIENKV